MDENTQKQGNIDSDIFGELTSSWVARKIHQESVIGNEFSRVEDFTDVG
jgi:hypothetical protein